MEIIDMKQIPIRDRAVRYIYDEESSFDSYFKYDIQRPMIGLELGVVLTLNEYVWLNDPLHSNYSAKLKESFETAFIEYINKQKESLK